MRSWLFPAAGAPARAAEATPQQVIATGAAGAAYGADGVDGERGWRRAGTGGHREVPWWTLEKARIYSVAAYRVNPMARAIIDTYTSFCVGDSGVSYQATNPQVAAIIDEFWHDPRVQLGGLQERLLRDHMLMGETALQLLVGELSGVTRICPTPISQITDVRLAGGNPLWPAELVFGEGTSGGLALPVAAVNDLTGLREGKVMWWRSWMALIDDLRGEPFLGPVLDHLDSYDQVISNLIDRTALARYLVWDVTVDGDQDAVDQFIKTRGGVHVPPSGSVEVHNQQVKWESKTAQTGAEEDSIAGKNVLTLIAGGAGLAKTWLAEPDGANRATSLTMAEPVRRRVGGVQKLWLGYQTELLRFVVDQAVRARRLPQMVTARDPRTGRQWSIPAAQTVTVTGPSISASDAEFTAKILLNLSTGLEKLVKAGVLSEEAARIAARKAWEDYMGVPYTADLDSSEADVADLATAVEESWGRRGVERRLWSPDAHPRDGRGRFSDKPGGGSGLVDRLRLGGRIALGVGEWLIGSDRARGGRDSDDLLFAVIGTQGGPRLRLGVVSPDEVQAWRAGDDGRTAEFGPGGWDRLHSSLEDVDSRADRREPVSGIVLGEEWGDIAYAVDDDNRWRLTLTVRPKGFANTDWSIWVDSGGVGAVFERPQLRTMIDKLKALRTLARRRRSSTPGGSAASREAADDDDPDDDRAPARHEAWDPDKHPRDAKGKFAEKPGVGGRLPSRRDRPGGGDPFVARPPARHLLQTGASGELDRLQREWASVLDGTYAGLTVRTTGAGPDEFDGLPLVMASANILDDGDRVGQVVRVIVDGKDGPYAVHGLLELEPHVQGGGFARAFNAHLERWYRQAGVTHIELKANIDVGGYAWARAGYDFADPVGASRILGRLEESLGRAERGRLDIPADRIDEQIAAAEALLERARTSVFGSVDYPSAYEIAMLGWWPGAGRDDLWIGKATLLGSAWNGVKPL